PALRPVDAVLLRPQERARTLPLRLGEEHRRQAAATRVIHGTPLGASPRCPPRRARRYAMVVTAMGGLAARLAGDRYLGIPVDRTRHAADLKEALGGIKGPLMKVAQLLATIPEALPEEYVRELIQLQANAPAMGWPFVRRRMMGELG